MIAAPHTSGWDYPLMILSAWRYKQKISWLGKKELFNSWYANAFFKFTGGIPVDRSKKNNAVKNIAEWIKQKKEICIVIPPEGTRSRKAGWHSGFYYIALEAGIHITCSFINFATKTVGIGPSIKPTGDIQEDMKHIREFYSEIKGKYPSQQSPIEIGVK